jgi:hypothetical protein
VYALSNAVRNNNDPQINVIAERLADIFKHADTEEKTGKLIDALCAKRADASQINAIYWLVNALNNAVRNNNDQQINVIAERLTTIFEQAKTANKTVELIDALCAKRADASQTNAIYWLVDALNDAVNNKKDQQINVISDRLTTIFKQAKTANKTAELIDALCAKSAYADQTNAIYKLVDALDDAVNNKKDQQVNVIAERLADIFKHADAKKTGELIDILYAKMTDSNQTNAIFRVLVMALDRPTSNENGQQMSMIAERLATIFEQAHTSEKTVELIDALYAKKAGADQIITDRSLKNILNEISYENNQPVAVVAVYHWINELTRGNISGRVEAAKQIIQCLITLKTPAVSEKLKTLIFTHKENLKEAMISHLAEIQDASHLKKITDKTTLLGQLIDHNTNSIHHFFNKQTATRDQVDKFIFAKKAKNAQKIAAKEFPENDHGHSSKKSASDLSTCSIAQLMYLIEVGVDSLDDLSFAQWIEFTALKNDAVSESRMHNPTSDLMKPKEVAVSAHDTNVRKNVVAATTVFRQFDTTAAATNPIPILNNTATQNVSDAPLTVAHDWNARKNVAPTTVFYQPNTAMAITNHIVSPIKNNTAQNVSNALLLAQMQVPNHQCAIPQRDTDNKREKSENAHLVLG